MDDVEEDEGDLPEKKKKKHIGNKRRTLVIDGDRCSHEESCSKYRKRLLLDLLLLLFGLPLDIGSTKSRRASLSSRPPVSHILK